MKPDVEYLTPRLTQQFVDRMKRKNQLDTLTSSEYTSHVNISKSDLMANIFVLLCLVSLCIYISVG